MVVKSGAKIVFLFQEGVLVYQNIVSFCQNITFFALLLHISEKIITFANTLELCQRYAF